MKLSASSPLFSMNSAISRAGNLPLRNLRVFTQKSERNALGLADGKTEVHAGANGIRGEAGDVALVKIQPSQVHVVTTTYAIERVVRVEVAETDRFLKVADTDAKAQAVAAAEHIVLLVVAAENQSCALSIPPRLRKCCPMVVP